MPATALDPRLDRILAFVDGLGLKAEIGAVPADAFLGGVRIDAGALVVQPENLLTPGDILHEAGHLAVIPARHRAAVHDDVDACVAGILAGCSENDLAGDPALAGLTNMGGEWQAIAWSYAACVHLDLPLETVFCPGAYGVGPEQSPMAMAQQCAWGFFPGIHRLVQTGMTAHPRGPLHPEAPPGGFPEMRFWVQP
jgi:hypothetical protein